MNILILGGTGEARELAARLVALGHEVTSSIAGRTAQPMLPPGELRVGKFGGVPGLAGYIAARRFDRLVDATHPYAGLISVNAVAAAHQTGIPLVRYMRPAWDEPAGANWRSVASIKDAAAALPGESVALITTGHDGLEHFLARDDCQLIVRLIEPPEIDLPRHSRLVLGRPPYTLSAERMLLEHEGVTQLVTKNSGGEATAPKLQAAAEMGVEVIMVDRPIYPAAIEVGDLDAAVEAITRG